MKALSLLLLCAVCLLAATVAAEQPPADAPKPLTPADQARRGQAIAAFEGGKLTVGDLEDAIERQSPLMRARYSEPSARKELYDKTLRFAMLAAEAERRGYAKTDTVAQAIKQNAVQALMKADFDETAGAAAITKEAIAQYYEKHLDEYVQTAMQRASQVVVATDAEAKAMLAAAKTADLRGFRQLAHDKSLDAITKARGGDLRYFDANGKVRDDPSASVAPAVAKAAFALKSVGDTSPQPIKVPGGFAILKLTGQRPAVSRKLADAEETIRVRLWREQRQKAIEDFVSKLKASSPAELHPELADAIKLEEVARGADPIGLDSPRELPPDHP